MATLTFYHHARVDGGRGTGIEINDCSTLEYFEVESEEFNPSLLWYVDLSCDGENLPTEAETGRRWFLDNEEALVGIVLEVAEAVEVGFDVEIRPFHQVFEDRPAGTRVSVLVSAIHRLQAREVAQELREMAHNLRSLLERLVSESLV